jgi:hypothetical protein
LDRRYCYWYPFSIRHHKATAHVRPFDYLGRWLVSKRQHRHRKKKTQFLSCTPVRPRLVRHEVVVGSSWLSWRVREQRLVVADGRGLHALLALLGNEGDSLTLLEGLEAVLLWWGLVMGPSEVDKTRVRRALLCEKLVAQRTQVMWDVPQWRGSGRRGRQIRSRG